MGYEHRVFRDYDFSCCGVEINNQDKLAAKTSDIKFSAETLSGINVFKTQKTQHLPLTRLSGFNNPETVDRSK